MLRLIIIPLPKHIQCIRNCLILQLISGKHHCNILHQLDPDINILVEYLYTHPLLDEPAILKLTVSYHTTVALNILRLLNCGLV